MQKLNKIYLTPWDSLQHSFLCGNKPCNISEAHVCLSWSIGDCLDSIGVEIVDTGLELAEGSVENPVGGVHPGNCQ